jgi:hypothetical protein
LAVLAAVLLLAACAGGAKAAPEIHELANIDDWNLVPKSSPARFVAGFERFCLDTPPLPATVAAALRGADYVPVPERRADGVTTFVVDDSRPMVMLLANGRGCAVAAESRSGQTERLRAMVGRRFPEATSIDPALVGRNTETAWLAPGPNGGIVFVQRLGTPSTPSRLILGIWRAS